MTAPPKLTLVSWPSCAVTPFPLVKRRELVERTAHNVAFRGYALGSRDPVATGEKLLRASLKAQRATMEKRGIDPETIERELQQFETAVRVRAAILLQDGGAA